MTRRRTTAPERVEQIMSRNVAACRPDDSLNVAAQIMWERDCGALPITVADDRGQRVVGMLTDRDVCMAAYTRGCRLTDVPVATVMSHGVRACGPADAIATALEVMAAAQLHRLPVLDEAGYLLGIVSLADLAREHARSRTLLPADALAKAVAAIAVPRQRALTVAA